MSNKNYNEAVRLFKELEHLDKDDPDNVKQALTLCDSVLKLLPDNEDALRCKLVVLINHNRTDQALKTITDAPAGLFTFERAYVLNKTGKYVEALAAIQDSTEPQAVHLRAQILHKTEKHEESAAVYADLIKQSKTTQAADPELICNYLAATTYTPSQLQASRELVEKHGATYDNCFNLACALIEAGLMKEAQQQLQLTEKFMKEAAKAQDWSPEQLEDEMAYLRVQQAYVLVQSGHKGKAKEILTDVLHKKPTSSQAMGVASNNLAAAHEEQDLFDSFKKLKAVGSVEGKLTSHQKLILKYNTAVLHQLMGKKDTSRSACEQMIATHPGSDLGPIALCSLLAKEKKYAKAEEVVKNFINKQEGGDTLRASICLAQIQATQNQLPVAAQTLEQIPEFHARAGIVMTLVNVYTKLNKTDQAIQVLDDAITYWKKQERSGASKDQLLELLKQSAKYKLAYKRYEDAASTFSLAIEIDNSDHALKSGRLTALAHCNYDEAEALLQQLPNVVDEKKIQKLSNDSGLETTPTPKLQAAPKQKPIKAESPPPSPKSEPQQPPKSPVSPQKTPAKGAKASKKDKDTEKQKETATEPEPTKKKKKNRHPVASPDGKADPERWKPLKERSYYKRKGQQRKDRKGK